MRTFLSFLNRRVREYAYLLTTFPVALVLFVLVQVGFATVFLPLAVLLLLALLTVMERVAAFEIRRTNRFLRTDFRVVDAWFGRPFFSWDGAKERVTSLRSWMASVYVLIAFAVSTLGFGVALTGVTAVVALVAGLGLLAITPFSNSLELSSTDGSQVNLALDFVDNDVRLQVFALDGADRFVRTGSIPLDATLTIALLLVGALLLLWLSSVLARVLARAVEGLLSGTSLPQIEMTLRRLIKARRVSERDVREAMEQPELQPELSELSARQREILALMAHGKSNAGIAKALYITEGSVEKHVSNILARLNLPPEEDSHRRVLAVLAYLGIDPEATRAGASVERRESPTAT